MKSIHVLKTMPVLLLMLIGIFMATSLSAKTVKEELDAAKKAKKTVFMVVTGNGVKADNSMKLAQQAQKQLKESVVLTLNRDDKANSDLVTNMGLSSAPLPLIMVVGMNGIPAGGLTEKDATAEKLVQMAPSAKKCEAITYIDAKKPVFIVAYKKTFADKAKVIENCKAASTAMKGNVAIVEINMDDPSEKTFLTQIGTDFKKSNSQIIVFNNQGKNTGTFSGITDPNKLTTAATTVPKSGCAPGSCAPGTKGCGK